MGLYFDDIKDVQKCGFVIKTWGKRSFAIRKYKKCDFVIEIL